MESKGFCGLLGQWFLKVRKADGSVIDYGHVSDKMVTKLGAKFITDVLKGTATATDLKYLEIGIGTAAESINDIGLYTDPTVAVGSTRKEARTLATTITSTQPGNDGIYTLSVDIPITSTYDIGELGAFHGAAGDLLFDRSLVSPVRPVTSGDTAVCTYVLTAPSGN